MIILTLRTDKPESEVGLYDDQEMLAYEKWEAHRQLAETLNRKIEELLESKSLSIEDINGIVCFLGPGSFTGLRIGVSVANALSYACDAPITGTQGQDWIENGISKLISKPSMASLAPEYGASVYTTKPKK